MIKPEKTKSKIVAGIALLLELRPELRDVNSREFEKEYLKMFVCENEGEKRIIEVIFNKAPSGATIKRYRAYIQNTLGLYPKSKQKREEDKKQEEKVKKDLGNILITFWKKIWKF